MTKYLGEDFLLTTKAARELYHGHAAKMPIIDYHCHLSPREIAEDRRWTDGGRFAIILSLWRNTWTRTSC